MLARPDCNDPIPTAGNVALIVDDDATIRDILSSLLTESGYTVMLAANGRDALSIAPLLGASVAIIDLAMPHMDGLQTCAALRKLPNWQKVPILVLTSHHSENAMQSARRAGASAFACKPFSPPELLKRIAAITSQGVLLTSTAPMVRQCVMEKDPHFQPINKVVKSDAAQGHSGSMEGPSVSVPQKYRILLAEDQQLAQEIARDILETAGFAVDVAADGREALFYVMKWQYDLVLLDVRMPLLGGIEVARSIRLLPNNKRNTPIVVMTAYELNDLDNDLENAGVNGYLRKPVSPEALLHCVQRHLGWHDLPRIELPPAKPVQFLDVDALNGETKYITSEAFARYLESLVSSIEDILAILLGTVTTEPGELVQRLHNLSGVAGTLGCSPLSDAVHALEINWPLADELQQEFIKIARGTAKAIRLYLEV